jgi:ATP synthase, F0 subunit b
MDILNTFGFNLKLFIGQVVNFLILVVLFQRFLYKPVLNMLKEREERIKKGLEDAARSKEVLAETTRDRDEILKKTRAEAQDIIENTKKIADEMKQEILAKSRAESEKLLEQAKVQAAGEMEKMEKQVQAMSLDLSQKILSNVVGALFTPEEKDKVLKKAVEKMEKEGGTLYE